MDDETAAQAFEPFFTTRTDAGGLGLAIVHAIVQRVLAIRGYRVLETASGVQALAVISLDRSDAILPKPFTPNELARTVRKLVDHQVVDR